MSLIEYFNITESCLGEPSYINSVLQCKIKFKLIAFHHSLDNQKWRSCISKMANWSVGATTVLSVPCVKTAALPPPPPCFKSWQSSNACAMGQKLLMWEFLQASSCSLLLKIWPWPSHFLWVFHHERRSIMMQKTGLRGKGQELVDLG